MNSRSFTVAAAAVAIVVSAQQELENDDADFKSQIIMQHEKMEQSLRYFDGVRGGWLGFNRGLYKSAPQKEMEKECLNNKARNNFSEAMSVWLGTGEVDSDVDILTSIGDTFELLANLNRCAVRKPWRDMYEFCSTESEEVEADPLAPDFDDLEDANKDRCSFSTILENLSKNAFVLMGKSGSMVEQIKAFPAENPEQLMVQAMTIGEDLGTFIRVGLDFGQP